VRRLLLAALICGLAPAFAQRGGHMRGGERRPPGPLRLPDQPHRGQRPHSFINGERDRGERRSGSGEGFFPGFYGDWFPGFWDGYDMYDGGGYAYPVTSNTTIVMPSPPAAPEKPPEPAQPVVHEYGKPGEFVPPDGPASQFSIVEKDGRVLLATAAWVQDDALHYLDSDGGGGHIPLNAVDRSSTARANAVKGLRLQVPAGHSRVVD
jgi:hypothetical protein